MKPISRRRRCNCASTEKDMLTTKSNDGDVDRISSSDVAAAADQEKISETKKEIMVCVSNRGRATSRLRRG